MTGTSEVSFFELDGQYLSLKADAAITLGQVVELTTTGCKTGTASGKAKAIGVAVAGYRTSRIATDNEIAAGNLVTVVTRGVVNVNSTAVAIAIGDIVEAGDDGKVLTNNSATGTQILGIALSAVGSAGGVVKVKLMRG
jgi:hypothetical protein